jgi:non-heme chloroperoxidase
VTALAPRMGGALLFGLLLAPAGSAQVSESAMLRSGFVTTADGVRIHYLEAGSGPAILFVPGWTMPAEIWEPQAAHFAKTHRVVLMDPRSQGRSSSPAEGHAPAVRARDIRAVVHDLKLAPVVLVGWSMAVMELAAHVEQFGTGEVAGLVLVDGQAGFDWDSTQTREIFGFLGQVQTDRRAFTANFVKGMFKRPQEDAYYEDLTRASLRTPTDTALVLLLGFFFLNDFRPALAKIDKPTLIVGAEGPWVETQRQMHERIAGSRLVLFENAGHALFVDEPQRFNSLLDEFLEDVASP